MEEIKKAKVLIHDFYSAMKLENLIEVFVNSQDIKTSSKEDYIKFLRQFSNWIIKRKPKEISREVLLLYKKYLQVSKKKPMTINSYLVPAKRFLTWAGYGDASTDIKLEKRGKGFRKDPLTVNQSRELLSIFDLTKIQGKRDYALINLMLRTGLRTNEVINCNIQDMRQVGGQAVLYILGKGRNEKSEYVVLTPEAQRPINEYLLARKVKREEEPIFVSISHRNVGNKLSTKSIRRIVKDYLRKIGIDSERISAHSLRHTAVTLALLGGASLQEAQAMARHSNINTTMIYSHNIDRVGDAAEKKIESILKDDKEGG